MPNEYLQQALAEIVAPTSKDAITENYRVHGCLYHRLQRISYIDDDGASSRPSG